MVIGLFTSRIVMIQLGVEDWGVYSAVSGVVVMFNVVTTALSSAVSRFITFELGRGDPDRLHKAFSSSVLIQIGLSLLIVLLTESVGYWYLHAKMHIPPGRFGAADLVLQMAMVTLVINLLSVPFNAVILAHEHMGAYAAIGAVEAVLRLGAALLLMAFGSDKLKLYAVLVALTALIVRVLYSLYCRRHFPEVKGAVVLERPMLREMAGFAGWNFLGSSAALFNTQGVNQLMNHFFGVVANAAYGVAALVTSVVRQFANSFNSAINPQITKSFASDNRSYCYELVCKGAKFSWLLMLLVTVPLCFEMDWVLQVWFKGVVPDGAALFTRLMLIGTMLDLLANSLATLAMATGDVKRYYLVIGPLSLLVFVLSWILYGAGMPAYVTYIVYIAVYALLVLVRLWLLRAQLQFPMGTYLRSVVLRIVVPTLAAAAAAFLAMHWLAPGWGRALLVLFASTAALALSAWLTALEPGEKAFAREKWQQLLGR